MTLLYVDGCPVTEVRSITMPPLVCDEPEPFVPRPSATLRIELDASVVTRALMRFAWALLTPAQRRREAKRFERECIRGRSMPATSILAGDFVSYDDFAYDDFAREQLRKIAAACGVPYEVLVAPPTW